MALFYHKVDCNRIELVTTNAKLLTFGERSRTTVHYTINNCMFHQYYVFSEWFALKDFVKAMAGEKCEYCQLKGVWFMICSQEALQAM
jgi:hypothetical protein